MKSASFVALFYLMLTVAPALGFHDDGVANCNGCHTMHNSQDGVLVDPESPNGNPWLGSASSLL